MPSATRLFQTVLLWSLLFASLAPSLHAQTGRASITGIVTDATGAVIPGVSVVAVQTETQVAYRTATNEAGYYTVASLPVGQYGITFSAAAFSEFSRAGLALEAGQVARIDVVLKVGAVSERVVVTAQTEMIQTETAQASKSVESRVFTSFPLSFSQGRNMIAFADRLVSGVQGEDWRVRIQGTPSASQSLVIDGMNVLSGRVPADFIEASISPEAVQEMTVFTGNANAEFGRGAGGTMNFSLKSGTNRFHGSGLWYIQNEFLNANDWNNNRMLAADPQFQKPATQSFVRPQDRRRNAGFSVGGPVLVPKLYNGRNRTFFHFTFEKFDLENSGPAGLIRAVPQPEMFDGDLSRLLTGTRVGADVLGRSVYEGQVYDPKTLREVNGQFVADPFLGNIIPASRISKVARNLKPVFAKYYPPVNSSLQNNLYWTRWNKTGTKQESIKVDHAFSSAHKMSGFWYLHDTPESNPSGGTGLWSLADPRTGGPLSRRREHTLHGANWNVNYDWVISPVLLNHLSFGSSTDEVVNSSQFSGKGLDKEWGINGVGLDLPRDKVTVPVINLAASPVMNLTSGWGMSDVIVRNYSSRTFNDSLSWQRRSHSFKAGVEWMRMTAWEDSMSNSGGVFNFAARTTAIPGQSYTARIGHSFASFLLGEVDSASISVPMNPNVRRDALALFVQDDWKATRRLTLNVGLRWSGDTAVTEAQDRVANFNPQLPDPRANNMPGAVEYMGSGKGRAGKRSSAPGYYQNFGPVFGLAYQVTPRTVLRASYSITYTPESIATVGMWQLLPGSFSAGFAQINAVEANSMGTYRPVFNVDDGYPGKTRPVDLDPSWGQRRASTRVSPNVYQAGYIQQFHFGGQFQASPNLSIETSWRANKGTRLHAGTSVVPNQIRQEELYRGAVLGQVIDTPQKAAAAGLIYPYAGWSGIGANTLMPFPQINTQTLTAWGDTVGFSSYHSGNLIVTKRSSRGWTAYGAYTFSKSITNVTQVLGSGDTAGMQDSYNRTLYKSIDPADMTHVLKSSLLWELPMGRGKLLLGRANRVLNAVFGNWAVSGLLRYSSGIPLVQPGSRNRPVGWNGPAVFANFNTPAGGFNRLFDPSRFNPWNPNDPGNRFFDPTAFSDAAQQRLGNSPARFPQLRMLWKFNEDAVFLKRFSVGEKARFELRVEFFNLFNRHYFGAPSTDMNDRYFGSVWLASGNRAGQCGLRVDW